MKRTRGLWASIIFVAVLVVASLAGFATGSLQPKLGLDLEGGISVILSAPAGTPRDVMDQALTNIRNRVDAFGVGEPQIFLSGSTIEIQIPGSANGTIEQRQKVQYCLVGTNTTNYGCSEDQSTTNKALGELSVMSTPTEVCVIDPSGKQLSPCYGSQELADAATASFNVAPKSASSPSPSATASPLASPSASPSNGSTPDGKGHGKRTAYCLTDANTGAQPACYPTKKTANAAQDGLTTKVTASSFCIAAQGSSDAKTPAISPTPTPSASSSPSGGGSHHKPSSPSESPTASPSPSPQPTAYSTLSTDGAQPLPCPLASKSAADTALAAISVRREPTEYCVVSSGGQNQGCFISQEAASEQQRRTGQTRLLSIIGKTARLEQRPVKAIIAKGLPGYDTSPVTCGTPEEQASADCSYQALASKSVVYLDKQDRTTKYQLGPVVLSGDQITKATATLSGGSANQVVTQWTVDFQLDGDGSKAFADATTVAVAQSPPMNQIAIVVDRQVISHPTVQGAITGGSGQISGGFSEQEAKDLATVLNAGALPVDLTKQSVKTVSPTLGKESLRQGIIAGLAGLILLFLYLLFYYRLLGIVAWFGMSIWAILAVALVSLAGIEFGYALSLAGVAGLVISLGVTADSYIVFFERLKDEVRSGKSPRSSVQPAFKRAYRTIVAADIVTGIAAVALYLTAVSSVRGFALTLGVATLLDLFVVWFFKRPTVFLIARNDTLVNLKGFGLTSGVAGEAEPGDGSARPARGEA